MHVTVMAKAPVAGRVKTRLCPPLSFAAAATVAAAALSDTLATVASARADSRIVALDGAAGPWLPPGFDVVPQGNGMLDQRLESVWQSVGGPGVQVGMDTPQMTVRHLNGAMAVVAVGDAIVGLASDGGWWLVGLPAVVPGVFDGVPMSTPHTGEEQIERLRCLGYRVRFAPVLRDVDTYDDLCAVAADAPGSRTAAALARVAE